jgi:hypothetical protein
LRLAISDGATDALYSGQWADALARTFCRRPRRRLTAAWLRPLSVAFRQSFDIATLPWYAQEKAGRGAFATLLGVTIDLRRRTYRAVAVGDSCLVAIRQDAVDLVFPHQLARPDAFGMRPYLVGSNPTFNERLAVVQATLHDSLPSGKSTFLLMTDALAAWFMRRWIAGDRPWRQLTEICQQTEFAAFVEEARRDGLRNDDVTLLRVDLGVSERD